MSDIILPCLSIQQPWPHAMFHLGKDYENRTWKTNFRGVFLIHAGKVIDTDGYETIHSIYGLTPLGDLPTGGIVGIAEITGCTDRSESDWFFGPYGFKVENAMELPFYPCKGRLNFWQQPYPNREIVEQYLLTKGW